MSVTLPPAQNVVAPPAEMDGVAGSGPGGMVHPGEGWTEVVVTPERGVRAVDGMLTGWHEPEASHLAMLEAVAGPALLARSYEVALAAGYLWHEFGDAHLLLP